MRTFDVRKAVSFEGTSGRQRRLVCETQGGDRFYVPGIHETAQLKMRVRYEAADDMLRALYSGETIKVTLPDRSPIFAHVLSVTPTYNCGPYADVVLRETRASSIPYGTDPRSPNFELPLHPNCRCVAPAITKEKPVKIRNKFYVAADKTTTPFEQDQDNIGVTRVEHAGRWTKKTLNDAIAHGQHLLEADSTKDHVAIVKIVKIVRRPKPKFIVEDVK